MDSKTSGQFFLMIILFCMSVIFFLIANSGCNNEPPKFPYHDEPSAVDIDANLVIPPEPGHLFFWFTEDKDRESKQAETVFIPCNKPGVPAVDGVAIYRAELKEIIPLPEIEVAETGNEDEQ